MVQHPGVPACHAIGHFRQRRPEYSAIRRPHATGLCRLQELSPGGVQDLAVSGGVFQWLEPGQLRLAEWRPRSADLQPDSDGAATASDSVRIEVSVLRNTGLSVKLSEEVTR